MKNIIIAVILVFVASIMASAILAEYSADATPTEITQATCESIETTESSIPATSETIHIETTETPSEAPGGSESEETVPVIDEHELELLACVIFQEAGWDLACDECRRRVADVVLNRVADDRFPDTIYEVLTQKSQYGRFHWTGVVWGPNAENPLNKHAVDRAYRIAEEVLSGKHSNLYGKGYIWQAEFIQGVDNIYCCGHYFGR